jgi:hypothetical protein
VRPAGGEHRFSFRLYFLMLGAFVVLFGAEFAIDFAHEASRTGRPVGEVWAGLAGSWDCAREEGNCTARASYSMLYFCLICFFMTLPFTAVLYTPKLIGLYLRDPVNLGTFALGTLVSANTHFQTTEVWPKLSAKLEAALPGWIGFYPVIAIWVNVGLIALAWATILPYILYTFGCLNPTVIVGRLESSLQGWIATATRHRASHRRLASGVRQAILDLSNLTLRAADRADRDLTLDGVRALGRTFVFYLDRKHALPPLWFRAEREWFAGLSTEAFDLIEREHIWIGHLILHQLFLAYSAALGKIPDAAPQVACIGLAAAAEGTRRGDEALGALGLRFANTLLREAIKRGDGAIVREVLEAHGRLLETIVSTSGDASADTIDEEGAHLQYYCAFARSIGAHDSADAVALALARLIESIASRLPRAIAGLVEAFERLPEPPRDASPHALVRARARVVSALADAERPVDAARAALLLFRAERADRDRARTALVAEATITRTGREAVDATFEPLPEERRLRMVSVLEESLAVTAGPGGLPAAP